MEHPQRTGSFRDLLVWQRAFRVCIGVYEMSAGFPEEERFGLTSEVRKTARSVVYNIAEGQQRETTSEFKRILVIARGSQGELETQLMLADALGYVSHERVSDLLERNQEVGRMLFGLGRSLNGRHHGPNHT